MIRVHVPCRVQEADLPRALAVYEELVAATRRELGCLSYELLQREDEPTSLLLTEEWESHDHLMAHTQTEHFIRLVAELESLEVAEPAVFFRRIL
ncbi:putative quinol monooxygenase [Oerskovia enterophila]|uniref:Autoinducer-2 (AI-2) modifying protein LsrG n=1 Tax=Oerskovia enterophila TaxID=43678 RepID=A0A163T9W6_9CELL|nr:putative quinol monooxygenase [Oerskovia enterophila]KZM37275.1 autoinducer-2 (AI-2) modifying protein LsrG [Oerskovia enterophila]OCI29230.1 autoinducer-2 (AI-2) modifying protein LsrG [Oerskovia enterophila]